MVPSQKIYLIVFSCFFAVQSSDFFENSSSQVPTLKILAARRVNKIFQTQQNKLVNLPLELRELIDLYDPLMITTVIQKLRQSRKFDQQRMQECIHFIKTNSAEICFETSFVGRQKQIGDYPFEVNKERFNRRLKRLQKKINRESSDIIIPISEDESREIFFRYQCRHWDKRFLPCLCCFIYCATSFLCGIPFLIVWVLK